MPDKVSKVAYAYVTVPDRAGQGANVLRALRKAKVNMHAYLGFPAGAGRAQLDIVPESMGALRRVAKSEGWKLSKVKRCFRIAGKDRPGAVEATIEKLARAGVSVTAASAMHAGKGAYGMVLWVKPQSYARAAKALGAR
jgi:predicted amino acid-binding ACT domain protein